MSTPIKSSLITRLPRPRLWFAGAGVAGIAGIAVAAGWMMLNTNPGNALMRPPALVRVTAPSGRAIRSGRASGSPRSSR